MRKLKLWVVKMNKKITDLSSEDAYKFLLQEAAYCTIDLPDYFSFIEYLKKLANIDQLPFYENNILKAKKEEGVNHVILYKKNGKYDWRKLEIIHPALYVSLVKLITEQSNWDLICKRINEIANPKCIFGVGMPVINKSDQKVDVAQIENWLINVEDKSLKLGLDFEYVYHTDIANCYGAIYTHSISWALHGKEEAKAHRHYDDLLGNKIDMHIQAMNYGQTNGIPQGSILMDFIAEIVLTYADDLLGKQLNDIESLRGNYHIIRYRDDYRIFVNNKNDGEEIVKNLSIILLELGLNINSLKTKESENIPTEVIKTDKYFMLYNSLPDKITSENELKNLLLITFDISLKYPNSGAINKRMDELMNLYRNSEPKITIFNPITLASIVINIAMKNPKSIPIIATFLSFLINKLKLEEKEVLMEKIIKKIHKFQSYGFLEVWLQRVTVKNDLKYEFKEKLCRIVSLSLKSEGLFESSWITDVNIKDVLKNTTFFDERKLIDLPTKISKEETELFKEQNPS